MFESPDMSTPVTRGELRLELAELEARVDSKLGRLDEKIEKLRVSTRGDLEIWGGALLARIAESEARSKQLMSEFATSLTTLMNHVATSAENVTSTLMTVMDQRFAAVDQRMVAMEQRLMVELARHSRVNAESLATQITAIDEKYSDLPERVSRLEAQVVPRGPR